MSQSFTPADLSLQLLYEIMSRMRERSGGAQPLGYDDFLDLLPTDFSTDERQRARYVSRHLRYLEGEGLVEIRGETIVGPLWIELTNRGLKFVQPELLQFERDVAARLVQEIEAVLDQTRQSEEQKAHFKYQFRKALADGAIDLVVKLLVEFAKKWMP